MPAIIMTLSRFAVCVCLIAAVASSVRAQPTGTGTFESDEHGLSIKLPAGWDEGSSSLPGSIAVFYSPDDKQGSLNLFYRDAAGKDADAVIAELQKEIRDHDREAKFEPTEDAKLGGKPARVFTYRLTQAGKERVGLMHVGTRADKAYVFMYSEPPAVYDQGVATVRRLIGALRWTK